MCLRDLVSGGRTPTVRFSRFAVVGGLCAVLSNTAVIVLVRYGYGSVVATLLAFGPVLLIGYALHSVFTFDREPSRLTFTRYALATAANLPIWMAALYAFSDVLRVSIGIVAPAATLLIFLWNYMSAKWAFIAEPGTAPEQPRNASPGELNG
jgi:putative flippase GtrA